MTELPRGWLCIRCATVNSPYTTRCDCGPCSLPDAAGVVSDAPVAGDAPSDEGVRRGKPAGRDQAA